MPSAKKTPNIQLNQWVGEEYVKRQDFVDDNLKIDTEIGELKESIKNIDLVDSKVKVTDTNNKFTGTTLDKVLDEIDDKIVDTSNKIDEKLKITYTEVTLEASSWSGRTYSLEATYPSNTYDLEVELSGNATKELAKVWSRAIPVESPDGKNIIKLLGIVPSVNIPVRVKAVKK